jgi:integrase
MDGNDTELSTTKDSKNVWKARYGERHRLVRITDFPGRITPPRRVRIYSRTGYFLLQFWDPAERKTLHHRVDGDLIDAVAKAREFDGKLDTRQPTGRGLGKLTHETLVDRYVADLHRRSDAGEISPATPRRFACALDHYLSFASQPAISGSYSTVGLVCREFALKFSAYLLGREIAPNGHKNCSKRRMMGQPFVLGVVRGMYEWGRDPDRGACLGTGSANPFRIRSLRPQMPAALVGEPDVTVAMATNFLKACDAYQLRLFAPMVLLGLRAAEPLAVMHEHLTKDSLEVSCIRGLDYRTKGVRDKQLPLLPEIVRLLKQPTQGGLLFLRRSVVDATKRPPLLGATLSELVQEYTRRCLKLSTAAARAEVRDQLFVDAGGLTYKMIQGEFTRVAGGLGWIKQATLKDFRHLFSTCMANGGVPAHECQYLLGHSTGNGMLLRYTHLNQVRAHYERAVRQEMLPILNVLEERQHS